MLGWFPHEWFGFPFPFPGPVGAGYIVVHEDTIVQRIGAKDIDDAWRQVDQPGRLYREVQP